MATLKQFRRQSATSRTRARRAVLDVRATRAF
jgi:hypothetical protein